MARNNDAGQRPSAEDLAKARKMSSALYSMILSRVDKDTRLMMQAHNMLHMLGYEHSLLKAFPAQVADTLADALANGSKLLALGIEDQGQRDTARMAAADMLRALGMIDGAPGAGELADGAQAQQAQGAA